MGSANRQKGNGSMIGHSFKKKINNNNTAIMPKKKRKTNFKNQKMFDAESLKRRSFTVRTDSDGEKKEKKTDSMSRTGGEKRK